jgi:DHA3 family macrolide efflux protein-like MFS transporter
MGIFVLIAPFAGVLVDRWNKKWLIAAVDFFQALITIVLILIFMYTTIPLWSVFLILAIKGVCQAFHTPATRSLIPLMIPQKNLNQINSINFVFNGVINLVGPLIGASLVEFIPSTYPIFWVDVGTFLIAIIPLLAITIQKLQKESPKEEKKSYGKEFRDVFSYIKSTRGLLTLLLLATALNFLITPVNTLAPYYVKFNHGGDSYQLAYVFAFYYGGILLGGTLMLVLRNIKNKMLIVMSFIYVGFVGYTVMSIAPWGYFWVLWIGAVIFGLAMPIVNVITQTIFHTTVPIEMQGRFQGVAFSLSVAAMPISMLVSGALSEVIGIQYVLFGCIGIGLLLTTILWIFTDVRFVGQKEENKTKIIDFNNNEAVEEEGLL